MEDVLTLYPPLSAARNEIIKETVKKERGRLFDLIKKRVANEADAEDLKGRNDQRPTWVRQYPAQVAENNGNKYENRRGGKAWHSPPLCDRRLQECSCHANSSAVATVS